MIHVSDFIKMLSIENNLIQAQTTGLTHADTLLQPAPSGNCMNWVLGHILENQIELLTALGGVSPVARETLAAYARESEPVRSDGPGVQPLETLLDGHARLHAALAARLAEMGDADFEREIRFGERTMSLGWRAFFLQFHLTYHTGQLELLRQMAGRSEKLI